MGKASFENLPDDILPIIFSYSDARTLCRLAQVNHTFYKLSQLDELWKLQFTHMAGEFWTKTLSQFSSHKWKDFYKLFNYRPRKNLIKVVFVGDRESSKTELLMSIVYGHYPSDYVPTVFDCSNVIVKIGKWEFTLGLWDTSGSEPYDKLRPLSYPGTNVFVLCFSVQHKLTFKNIKSRWMPEVRKFCNVPVVLCATQVEERENSKSVIKLEDGKAMAKEINAVVYVETSAKKMVGVNDILHSIVYAYISDIFQKDSIQPQMQNNQKKSCVVM